MWTPNWILHGRDDFASRDRTLRANDNCTSETPTEPNSVIQDALAYVVSNSYCHGWNNIFITTNSLIYKAIELEKAGVILFGLFVPLSQECV